MDEQRHVEALNARFGVPGIAQVQLGNGSLPVVRITSPTASGEIYLYGAQVTSWRPAGAEEVIFVSSKSKWERGQAIRGGIPICFPWFRAKADDPLAPKHGFLRTHEWRLDSIAAQDDGAVTVVCVIEGNGTTQPWWPHEFCVAYRVTLGKKLRLELSVINTGDFPMRYEEALHTYFRVGSVEQARVQGLNGIPYLDNTDQNRRKRQAADVVFAGPVDNAYMQTTAAVTLLDRSLQRRVRTDKQNSGTTVVWNPGPEGARDLADMRDDEWQHMACVEASNILNCAVLIGPGEEHTLRATLDIATL